MLQHTEQTYDLPVRQDSFYICLKFYLKLLRADGIIGRALEVIEFLFIHRAVLELDAYLCTAFFGSAVAVSGTGQGKTSQSLVTPVFAGFLPIAENGIKAALTT